MDQLGLRRYCCRRMVMTHVDLIEKLLKYDQPKPRVKQTTLLQSTRWITDYLPLGTPPTDATKGRTSSKTRFSSTT